MSKKIYGKIICSIILCAASFNNFAQQWNGLTLIAVKSATTCRLVDTAGVTVKTWTCTGGGNGYPAYMIPGGTIYRTISVTSSVVPQNGGMTGRIQKIDYAGNLLWEYTYNSPQGILHHDITVLPNGNILATAYDVKNAADIAAAGCTSTVTEMWSERIMELEPVGSNSANIVWEWKMWDHLVQNVMPAANNYQTTIVDYPELWNINYQSKRDFFHMNGLDYNPVLDQICFSSHWRNEWYIIDHSTSTAEAATHTGGNSGKGGDILYRWGNPAAYQATGPTICNVTHDAHFIPDGSPNAGYLVGFNNGGQILPSLRSTIDRVSTPRVGYNYTITPGSAFTPTTYNARYVCTAYSSGYSSSEQFENGNQMICLAGAGVVYEVNAGGTLIWSYNTGGLTPQAHRYSPCYVNNAAPPQPSISVFGSSLVCTNATTYQWYLNGDAIPSATNQAVLPVQDGMYLVRITDVNGCAFFYSSGMFYSIPVPTGLAGLSAELNKIQLYPNPSNGRVYINMNRLVENFEVEVRSASGQLILKDKNNSLIDLGEVSNGIYFITIITEKGNKTKKITILK